MTVPFSEFQTKFPKSSHRCPHVLFFRVAMTKVYAGHSLLQSFYFLCFPFSYLLSDVTQTPQVAFPSSLKLPLMLYSRIALTTICSFIGDTRSHCVHLVFLVAYAQFMCPWWSVWTRDHTCTLTSFSQRSSRFLFCFFLWWLKSSTDVELLGTLFAIGWDLLLIVSF